MPVKDESMVPVRFTIPRKQAEKMHALVENGDYPADAEVYRDAIRGFLEMKKTLTLISSSEGAHV
jgi:Arc/MetJ-type ribon-helix-helix transcriptional regulator